MDKTIESLAKEVAAGMKTNDVVAAMKQFGWPPIKAIKAVRVLYSVDLGAAKKIVTSHESYIEAMEAAAPLQNEFVDALEELNDRRT